MLEHLLGLESAGVTRASRQGDKEQQALSAAIMAGHIEVSGDQGCYIFLPTD